MKTTLKGITQTVVLMAAVIMFTIYGCKKVDNSGTKIEDDVMAIVKANIAKQFKEAGGIKEIFPVNKHVVTTWADKNQKPATKADLENSNFTSACSYTNPYTCDLVQYARTYKCEASPNGGYFIEYEYTISWDNWIVPTNFNYGISTEGYIDVRDNSTGISILPGALPIIITGSEVIITDLGLDPDPSAPSGNHLINVKFSSQTLLPASYLNSNNNTVYISAVFANDCKYGTSSYGLWVLPVNAYGFSSANAQAPCERNERIYVTAAGSGGTGTNYLVVNGFNSAISPCTYSGSFVRPDLQEVEYNVDGGSWAPTTNVTPLVPTTLANQPFIRGTDVARASGLPSGNHLIGVRYRNWQYIGTNPSGWPIPATPADCHSIGNTTLSNPSSPYTYSTYAYNYYPCIIP